METTAGRSYHWEIPIVLGMIVAFLATALGCFVRELWLISHSFDVTNTIDQVAAALLGGVCGAFLGLVLGYVGTRIRHSDRIHAQINRLTSMPATITRDFRVQRILWNTRRNCCGIKLPTGFLLGTSDLQAMFRVSYLSLLSGTALLTIVLVAHPSNPFSGSSMSSVASATSAPIMTADQWTCCIPPTDQLAPADPALLPTYSITYQLDAGFAPGDINLAQESQVYVADRRFLGIATVLELAIEWTVLSLLVVFTLYNTVKMSLTVAGNVWLIVNWSAAWLFITMPIAVANKFRQGRHSWNARRSYFGIPLPAGFLLSSRDILVLYWVVFAGLCIAVFALGRVLLLSLAA